MALKLSKRTKVKKIIKRAKSSGLPVKEPSHSSDQAKLNYPQGTYTEAVGRRKVATARVRLYEEKADSVVNDSLLKEYFAGVPRHQVILQRPFDLTGTKGKFSLVARVTGSGIAAQLEAVVHGISRALAAYDPSFRSLLKAEGLLTRDDRMKETRKIGRGGKARRKRQSPKR